MHSDLKYDKNAVLGYITVAYNGKDDFFLEYFFYWIVGGLVQLVPDYPHDGIQKYQKKAWYCEFQVSGKIPIIECIFKNPSNRWIRNILLHNSPNIRVLMRDARPWQNLIGHFNAQVQ